MHISISLCEFNLLSSDPSSNNSFEVLLAVIKNAFSSPCAYQVITRPMRFLIICILYTESINRCSVFVRRNSCCFVSIKWLENSGAAIRATEKKWDMNILMWPFQMFFFSHLRMNPGPYNPVSRKPHRVWHSSFFPSAKSFKTKKHTMRTSFTKPLRRWSSATIRPRYGWKGNLTASF